jgi:dipeptidyl aminopeptidase/acylaminoacyl peptidase
VGTRAIRLLAGAGAVLGLAASLAACGRVGAPEPAAPAAQPLIARADLFGDPVRQGGQLSPLGDGIAFLAPRDGVINLWALSVDAIADARPLTDDRARGVSSFAWAHDNTTLLYGVDEAGDGAMRLYAVAKAGDAPPRALTPEGADARILGLSGRDPSAVIIALRARAQGFADVVRIDIASGAQTTIYRNTGGYSEFLVDGDNQLRVGMRRVEGGGQDVAVREANGRWRTLLSIAFSDAMSSRLIAFEAGEASFLMLDATDRDRTALVRVDVASGVKTVVGESARADVVDVWLDPVTRAPEAFATDYLRREWRALSPDAQADLDFLDSQLSGEFEIASRDGADARWIVEEEGPATPTRSYLFDREARRLSLLFRHRPALEQAALQPMTPVEIEARDGLTLVTYLTLPTGSDADGDARPDEPVPLVLTPHDGPWARDSYGFNALHQWLANRGYAVMSVNFRGSLGFSKAFVNAGNREWGGRVQADLSDAVEWAIANGVAREDRIAIVGSGFGGYAALAGLAFSPGRYRCGASFGGTVNLTSFIETAPAQERAELYERIGDLRTPEGRATLRDASPISRAARVENTVLMALGGRDGRVPRADADSFAQAIRARGGALTYMMFPDEGRALYQPPNRLAYFAVLEHFLGDCLGGRVEPVGAAFEGASLEVFDGAVNVPGLSAFARRQPTARAAPAASAPGASPHEDIASAPDAPPQPSFQPAPTP